MIEREEAIVYERAFIHRNRQLPIGVRVVDDCDSTGTLIGGDEDWAIIRFDERGVQVEHWEAVHFEVENCPLGPGELAKNARLSDAISPLANAVYQAELVTLSRDRGSTADAARALLKEAAKDLERLCAKHWPTDATT